jgi:hypothetical protein
LLRRIATMKEQLISAVAGLAFALVGALLVWLWPADVRVLDAAFLGCFAYTVTSVALVSWKTRGLESYEALRADVSYAANRMRVQEAAARRGTRSSDFLWALCLLRAREGIYSLLDSSSFRVDRDQIPKFWQQAIINTDSTWLCTNFVNLEEDWRYGWTERGLQFQGMGIQQNNVNVRRVFIYGSASEITPDLVATMRKHEELHVQVKWTTLDADYHYWAPFEKFEREVGTIDLAIVDGSYLLAFDLNASRENVAIRCYSDPAKLDGITSLYARLWEEARDLKELECEVDEGVTQAEGARGNGADGTR